VSEKVDIVQILNLEQMEELNVPRLAHMFVSKDREGKSFFQKLSNKGKKLTDTLGLTQCIKLMVLCDGCKEGSCSNPHSGYSFEAPGKVLQKLAPVIIFACKYLVPALKLGVAVAGVHIPDFLTNASESLQTFSALLDTPLTGQDKTMFDSLYGKQFASDNSSSSGASSSSSPCMSDLVQYMASDVSQHLLTASDKASAISGASMKEHREEFSAAQDRLFGDGYRQLKELLESKTSWNSDKKTFYLQKYIQRDNSGKKIVDIKWLCEKHVRMLNIKIGESGKKGFNEEWISYDQYMKSS
jgi:hypothetical protein